MERQRLRDLEVKQRVSTPRSLVGKPPRDDTGARMGSKRVVTGCGIRRGRERRSTTAVNDDRLADPQPTAALPNRDIAASSSTSAAAKTSQASVSSAAGASA